MLSALFTAIWYLLMLIIYLVLGLVIGFLIFYKLYRLPHSPSPSFFRNLLIAHRGCRIKGHPKYSSLGLVENTLSAFKWAASFKVDALEFDLRLTKDGKVIIFHDEDLNRLCEFRPPFENEKRKEVVDFSYEELKTMTRLRNCAIEGEQIPLFEQLLELNEKELGRLKMMVEIKHTMDVKHISSQVVKLFQKYNLHDRAVIGSFSPLILYEVRKQDPTIVTLLLVTRSLATSIASHSLLPATRNRLQLLLSALDQFCFISCVTWLPSFLNCGVMGVDVEILREMGGVGSSRASKWIKSWYTKGMEFNCWTVNDVQDKKALVDLGVSVTTDYLFD